MLLRTDAVLIIFSMICGACAVYLGECVGRVGGF